MPKVKNEHKERRRREILEAARRVFRRKGYGPTTMHDIIAEAGMSRGGVYLYFPSKEDLFMALLDLDLAELMHQTAVPPGTESVWAAHERSLDLLLESLQCLQEDPDHAAALEFWLTGLHDPKRVAFTEQRYDASVRHLASGIQAGVDAGEFRPLMDVETIARVMLSFTDGINLETLFLGPERTDIRAQVDAIRAFLRYALQVTEPRP